MTIKKIAKLAGVSIGTVDRVIHSRGRVSSETKKKVNEIIKKYKYKPNFFASSLSLSKSYTFGVLMPVTSQDSGYWAMPEKGIQNAYNELSIYNIHIKYFYFNKHDETSFKKAWKEMLASKINGIIIAPVFSSITKYYLISEMNINIPIVFFDSYIPEIKNIAFIGQDSYQSGILSAKLMKMLINEKEEIAVIRVVPDDYHINQRSNGFQHFFKNQNGYKVKLYDIFNGDNSEEFKLITRKVIEENKNLAGIFVTNASTHYIAKNIKAVTDKKISLIGYDLIQKNIYYLKEGIIDFLISQRPEHQGYQSVYALYRSIVLKKKLQKELMMPIDIITKENINYYIE
ncbi:MAG: substrate-binding domain-containing protein [Spirochaetes bacterium]|nr:substrate-binding domain-containing protein [Spirochaetota bacterium]